MNENLKDEIIDNKDSIDNLKLMCRTPLLNGRIETLEKINSGFYSNLSLSMSSIGKNRSTSAQKNHKYSNDLCESPSHFSGKKKVLRASGNNNPNQEYIKEMLENSKKVDFLDCWDDDDDIPFENPIVSKRWPELKEFEPKNLEIKE